ncbi:MAG: hypothetical protein L6R35_002647 [Caloplaca aegaea]|nr:MAG: hypothetical protein L6R35_002647 [Caloplaca aegaea]
MGICSSCLGDGRKQHKDPETSRLLSDDPYRATYGSRSQNPRRSAEEAEADDVRRRERAILESIAHGMSECVLTPVCFAMAVLTRAVEGKWLISSPYYLRAPRSVREPQDQPRLKLTIDSTPKPFWLASAADKWL